MSHLHYTRKVKGKVIGRFGRYYQTKKQTNKQNVPTKNKTKQNKTKQKQNKKEKEKKKVGNWPCCAGEVVHGDLLVTGL